MYFDMSMWKLLKGKKRHLPYFTEGIDKIGKIGILSPAQSIQFKELDKVSEKKRCGND